MEDKLIGDPIERATLSVLPWTLTKGDVVMCKTIKQSLKIQKRFHFNRYNSKEHLIYGTLYNYSANEFVLDDSVALKGVIQIPWSLHSNKRSLNV